MSALHATFGVESAANIARMLANATPAEREEVARALRDVESGAETPDLGLKTLRELLDDPGALEPPEPVADRIVYKGYGTLLASREKLGKSTLTCAVAAAVSAGTPWLDSPATPGRVLS
jgi:hypothetical protein